MVKYEQIFSEYDIVKTGIRFDGEEEATVIDTVGSANETMEVRTVQKMKRNMPWKTRTKPTGSGEVAMKLHLPEDIYAKTYGMYVEGYKEGVMVYGTLSMHATFCMTQLVVDEDGNRKLVAYPCCSVKTGKSRNIEANAETIAEIEMTVAVDPDEDGQGYYAIIVDEEQDAALVDQWMKAFDPVMVKESSLTD